MFKNIAIIGGGGAIGRALDNALRALYPDSVINIFSRSGEGHANIDYKCEESIKAAAEYAAKDMPLDFVLVTTGILHDKDRGLKPEKSLNDLSFEAFEHVFTVNTVIPAIIAKYFVPRLSRDHKTVFAALSARVGSISDNYIGGWYAYRASKAALNMIIKNTAIETARKNKQAIIIGLHPGTVDSNLSKPFQSNVADGKLFSPDQSAHYLIKVIHNLGIDDNGKCFAWDGQEILP